MNLSGMYMKPELMSLCIIWVHLYAILSIDKFGDKSYIRNYIRSSELKMAVILYVVFILNYEKYTETNEWLWINNSIYSKIFWIII